MLYACDQQTTDKSTSPISEAHLYSLNQAVKTAFEILRPQSIRPDEGFIQYDYLIPAGFYKQMWDDEANGKEMIQRYLWNDEHLLATYGFN